jgi:hypothetical protein
MINGSFVSDGNARSVQTVDFRPTRVEIHNDQGDSGLWMSEMADDSMHKRVAGGTGSIASSAGITPLANGFTLGADADLNAATQVTYWTCYE